MAQSGASAGSRPAGPVAVGERREDKEHQQRQAPWPCKGWKEMRHRSAPTLSRSKGWEARMLRSRVSYGTNADMSTCGSGQAQV